MLHNILNNEMRGKNSSSRNFSVSQNRVDLLDEFLRFLSSSESEFLINRFLIKENERMCIQYIERLKTSWWDRNLEPSPLAAFPFRTVSAFDTGK